MYGIWMITAKVSQGTKVSSSIIISVTHVTLVPDVDSGETAYTCGGGAGVYGQSFFLPLSFL